MSIRREEGAKTCQGDGCKRLTANGGGLCNECVACLSVAQQLASYRAGQAAKRQRAAELRLRLQRAADGKPDAMLPPWLSYEAAVRWMQGDRRRRDEPRSNY